MKHLWPRNFLLAMLFAALPMGAASNATAQTAANGSIEFAAEVQPTNGQPEPARQLPLFVLRKSFEQIRAEAEQTEKPKDMTAFIDSLGVSPELKAWMKSHNRVELAGTDFTKQLTADDMMNVPEFMAAYRTQNGSALEVEIPEPKPKTGNKPGDKEKYEKQMEQYRQSLKHYIQANLDSLQGLDADLGDDNAARRWNQVQSEQKNRIDARAAKMAQTQYLVAKASSDLNGRGSVINLAPGEYWITTLDTPAMAGDLRLRWDVSVEVRPGQTTRIELSNLNALEQASAR